MRIFSVPPEQRIFPRVMRGNPLRVIIRNQENITASKPLSQMKSEVKVLRNKEFVINSINAKECSSVPTTTEWKLYLTYVKTLIWLMLKMKRKIRLL